VSALIVKDGRIISTGYNGTLKGAPNCCEVHGRDSFDREEHHKWSLMNEIHAEQNAIAVAAKTGISLDGCICYCSLQPCNTCLLLLIQTGIREIVYVDSYDKCNWSPGLMKTVGDLGIVIRQV
jgi:dCMP deaminase